MKKNDKIIVIFGVIILVLASIGVYYWDVADEAKDDAVANDFAGITGVLKSMPSGITVSVNDPFYALVATPLAVNYNEDGEQSVTPLLAKDFDDPSSAVTRFFGDQIYLYPELTITDSVPVEKLSLDIAKTYWKTSKAALLIENNSNGYELGVAVTPVASYLRIPVIIANSSDTEYVQVLNKLGVKYTMICGNLEGYGHYVKFEDIDQVIDFSVEIIDEKFEKCVDYITLTNPIDAFRPKVLERTETKYFGPVTLQSSASTTGFVKALGVGKTKMGSFQIPEDYKYALVKFEGENLDIEDVEELGDGVTFSISTKDERVHPKVRGGEIIGGNTRKGGWGERDTNGKIIRDYVYTETVLYDRGGVEYDVTAKGSWLAQKQGRAVAKVTVEKLENPRYAMMKGISSVAPYLTAYRQGIIFARPEFAFTVDNHVIDSKGNNLPGTYTPFKNIGLIDISNKHMEKEVNEPLNNLLAKLANIEIRDDRDIGRLRDHYAEDPVYIALAGGATMLPQYYYNNYNQPIDVDNGNYGYGSGTPSDVYYGNIDPIKGDYSNEAKDMYSEYPFQENIVGRITGYDAQDASALVSRTIFYDEIINNLGEWKDNFGLLMGGGCDFRKPSLRYRIFGDLLGIVHGGEPMKLWTGCQELNGLRVEEKVAEPLDFDVQLTWEENAQLFGFSEEALDKINDLNLKNKLFFRKHLVRNLVGENVVNGEKIVESSNFIFINGHGMYNGFGLAATRLTASGLGGILVRKVLEQVLPIVAGGFMGPGSSLADLGDYGTRACSGLEMGPSFYWLESCICGKIDGLYPKLSVGQAILHSGVNALVAASTTSNIAGGYVEPKTKVYDLGGQTILSYIKAKNKAKQGIYPEPHFGFRIHQNMCKELEEKDCSIGLALRNSKNIYLKEDADWQVWWSPPLVYTGDPVEDWENYKLMTENYKDTAGSGPAPMMKNKYTSYQEYVLFADPAFNPYEPVNNG